MSILIPVLMCSSKNIKWNTKHRSKMQFVKMRPLRGVLGVRKIYTMSNLVRERCGIKVLNEKINTKTIRLLSW